MFYRDLGSDEIIRQGDQFLLRGTRDGTGEWGTVYHTHGDYGRRVDETGLLWRRPLEGNPSMHEAYDPQALSAVWEDRDRLARRVVDLEKASQTLLEERDALCRQLMTAQEQLRRVTKERDDLNGAEWPYVEGGSVNVLPPQW